MKTFTIYLQSLVNSTKDFDLENPEVFTTEYTIEADTYYEATQIAKQQHNLSVWESWGEEKLIETEPIKTITLTFAVDDLELINQALCRLLIFTKNEDKKSEISRMIWQISQAINPELYEGADSNLMNS